MIIECEQRSDEWYAARLGIPTASNFDKIITTEGKQSKQRTKYMYQLAGESITGVAEETFKSSAMERGIELEAEARSFYEFYSGLEVKQVGFVKANADIDFGASPDGLVGDDGLIEIKCPTMAVHVGYLLDGKLPTEYIQQVQGELLVCERDWCDFVSYYPGLKPLVVRVERSNLILAMIAELGEFCKELEEVKQKLRGM